MPITKSAKKALRVSKRKRVFNDRRRKEMRGTLKEVRTLLSAGKKDEAEKLVPRAYKAIDKAAKRGVIKKNSAARTKSRIVKRIKNA